MNHGEDLLSNLKYTMIHTFNHTSGLHEHYDPHPYQYNYCCYEPSNINFDYQVDQAYSEPLCQALLALKLEKSIKDVEKAMPIMQQRIETMQ